MRPFQEHGPDHTFKSGSTLKAVVDIYRFDGSLRRITMDAIERVEVAIRATISNHMCPNMGTIGLLTRQSSRRPIRILSYCAHFASN